MKQDWLHRDLGYPPSYYRYRTYARYFGCFVFACFSIFLFWFGDEPMIRFVMAPIVALLAFCSYLGGRRSAKEADRRAVNHPAPNSADKSDSN